MTYAELSEAQARRSMQFAEAQTDVMSVYCDAERDLKELQAENAKLREQMERLVTLLRVDCDIDASWDGLRRFWSIGLTEDGCLMRDRACKAEAENAKLRELVRIAGTYCVNGLCGKDDGCPLYLGKPYCALPDRMRDLGIELNDYE